MHLIYIIFGDSFVCVGFSGKTLQFIFVYVYIWVVNCAFFNCSKYVNVMMKLHAECCG